MLDHVGLQVSDRERSKRFYAEALSPLGYGLVMEHRISGVGFGRSGKPEFWIREATPAPGVHVAFAADHRAAVDAYYEAAIAAGGGDNGRPGPRPEYHPAYYGAFVLDPDGYNVEAVCHEPGDAA